MPPGPNTPSLNDLEYLYYPLQISDTQTLVGNNATVAVPIFGITGSIEVFRLWGVVTATLGSNVTAAAWRLNDQTAQVDISLAAGSVISNFTVGSLLIRRSIASVALTNVGANTGKVTDPVAATAPDVFMPFTLTQKTGGVTTNVEFVYTTTNTPTSGTIQFFMQYRLLSAGSSATPL